MKILVCEDQDSIRKMIEALVTARGYEVLSAANGAQALELAQAQVPAVALLDLTMPGEFDGLEVCRRLRAQSSTSNIPILIVTALDDEGSRQQARLAGATAYYTKPFSPIALLREIERFRTTPTSGETPLG